MKNCNLTKWNVEVDGNLPKFGVLELIGSSVYIGVNAPVNTVLLKSENSTFGPAGTVREQYAPASSDYYNRPDEGVSVKLVTAENKYALTRIKNMFPSNGFSEFKYLNNLAYIGLQLNYINTDVEGLIKDFNFNDLSDMVDKSKLTTIDYLFTNKVCKGNLNSLSGFTNLVTLVIRNSNISGDISALAGLTHLVTIGFGGSSVTGNISNLGALTSLSEAAFEYTYVAGSVEDFVKGQYSAGRTTESTGVKLKGEDITFNGSAFGNAQFHTITWAPHSGDVTKIDVSKDGSTPITIDA
jgi:hypothetical protein